MSCLNRFPSLVFIAPYALRPRSLRSTRAVWRLRDGVIRNPRYLYSLTTSTFLFSNQKFRRINLPVLLKIIHLVFSRFTSSRLFLVYFSRFFSMLLRPCSDSDNINKSSAHISEFRVSVSSTCNGSLLLRGRPPKKII